MSNPNFSPTYSTNEIYRDLNMGECLTDDLDAIEESLENKAESGHTHSEYASTNHEHTGYAPTNHEHEGYASSNHTHTEYASNEHTHSEYAPASHAHTEYASANHTHVVYGGNGASTYKKVWIATTGDDANEGTSASPMATITGAIRKYSEKYKMLDISLASGTYNENLGAVSPSLVNLAIRSNTENKDDVTLNFTSALENNIPILRLYNITINITETGVRPISVTGGLLYAYNIRVNVPTDSGSSCVNVYNGCNAMLMNCVLNSGTGNVNGACVYGNQAGTVKAINCTSERQVAIAFYAHNGTEIIYTDTINAVTKTKTTFYGKCTLRE